MQEVNYITKKSIAEQVEKVKGQLAIIQLQEGFYQGKLAEGKHTQQTEDLLRQVTASKREALEWLNFLETQHGK